MTTHDYEELLHFRQSPGFTVFRNNVAVGFFRIREFAFGFVPKQKVLAGANGYIGAVGGNSNCPSNFRSTNRFLPRFNAVDKVLCMFLMVLTAFVKIFGFGFAFLFFVVPLRNYFVSTTVGNEGT